MTDVIVSHTHMDHFVGFDQLLRVLLVREKALKLFGPPGILANVEGKGQGYTWNLVDEYPLTRRSASSIKGNPLDFLCLKM